MKTRAKFYITDRHASSGNAQINGKWETCEVTRVTLQAAYSSDKTTENYAFWTASPSGKMEIVGPTAEMAKYVVGSYWYIDEEPIDQLAWAKAHGYAEVTDKAVKAMRSSADIWRLSLMEKLSDDQLRVKVQHDYSNWIDITINNKSAWESYRQLDDLYRVELLPAEK